MSAPLPTSGRRSIEVSPLRNTATIRINIGFPIPMSIPSHSPKVWMKFENTGMATKSS